MELFIIGIIGYIYKYVFLKLENKIARNAPILMLGLTCVVSIIATLLWTPPLLPIKPDQVIYFSVTKNLSITSLKIDLIEYRPEISFHYGMWYLSTFIHKYSFFSSFTMRLINILILLLSFITVKNIAKNWVSDFTAEKISLIFLCAPSLIIFSQLYLKDLIIVFSILLIFQFAVDIKLKNAWLPLVGIFLQYHFRMPLIAISLLLIANAAFIKHLKSQKIFLGIFILEVFGMYLLTFFKPFLPSISHHLIGALEYISTPSNFIHFLYNYFVESLGLSFLLRPASEFEYSIIKVIFGRIIVIDSLIIPTLMFYFLIKQMLRQNFKWLILLILPSILYYLIYYYNYEVLKNESLYSFRVSLPIHALYIVFVLISYFKDENNIRSR
jgi:hypothetical protein